MTCSPIGMMRLAILLLAAMAAPAAAADYKHFQISDAEFDRVVSHDYNKCMDQSGGVTSNMRDCSAAEFKRLDSRLNDEYRKTVARVRTPDGRTKLRDSERHWLTDRWRECNKRAAEEEGGTIALVISDGCALSELARRIVWLQRYAT